MYSKKFFQVLSIVILSAIAFGSCAKLGFGPDSQNGGKAVAHRINIDNAAGLALMKVDGNGQPVTKGFDNSTRLVVIGKDGSTRLAEFDIDLNFKPSRKVAGMDELLSSITLVPLHIQDIASNFLLLSEMSVEYEGSIDHWSYKDNMAFSAAISPLHGSYLLRKSDGALFRCPFTQKLGKYPKEDVEGYCRDKWNYTTMDLNSGKEFVVSGNNLNILTEFEDGSTGTIASGDICVVRDEGDKVTVKHLGGNVITKRILFSYMPADNTIVAFADDMPNGVWSFDLELNPLFVDMSKELADIVSSRAYQDVDGYVKNTFFVANGRNAYLFDATIYGDCVTRIYKLDYDKNEIACHLISENEDSACNIQCYDYSGDNIVLMSNDRVVTIDTNDDSVVFKSYPQGFPNDWRLFYENGIYYELSQSLQEITKYDLQEESISPIPVQWGNHDALVSATVKNEDAFFSVYGVSRTAQKLAYLIEKATGKVTLLSESEYTGPIILGYSKLN